MVDRDDTEAVHQTLHGDTRAFEKIVGKYYKTVYNVILRMGVDCDDAYDITQTVFVKVFENLKSYKSQYKFFSWLYRITLNETLNFLDRQKEDKKVEIETLTDSETPEQEYQHLEVSEMVQEAVWNLELDYRVVIVLKHFHNLSYHEIGFILDLPEKTVKSRLFTARELLRDILVRKQGME